MQPGELEVDPGPVKVAEVERHPQLLLAGAGVMWTMARATKAARRLHSTVTDHAGIYIHILL